MFSFFLFIVFYSLSPSSTASWLLLKKWEILEWRIFPFQERKFNSWILQISPELKSFFSFISGQRRMRKVEKFCFGVDGWIVYFTFLKLKRTEMRFQRKSPFHLLPFLFRLKISTIRSIRPKLFIKWVSVWNSLSSA